MWRVARSLDVLLEEVNAFAPLRSKVADGSIGDAAHASRDSDHNPWVTFGGQGIVRARDITHDPANGLDCQRLADNLAALLALGGHPAAREGAYVIWRGRIFSFDRRHEGWRPYSGSNPHGHHLHLSVALDPAGFDSTRPWGVTLEDDMFSDEDRDSINAKLDRLLKKAENSGERERNTNELLRAIKRQGKVTASDLDKINALLLED